MKTYFSPDLVLELRYQDICLFSKKALNPITCQLLNSTMLCKSFAFMAHLHHKNIETFYYFLIIATQYLNVSQTIYSVLASPEQIKKSQNIQGY